MYAITGITGHVGGATATALLDAGAPVRAVVRNPAKATEWAERGAEIAVADLTDPTALTTAYSGCAGVFVMLPTLPSGEDAEHRALVDTIAAAVAASGVAHVVALSSYGADLAEGTGPIRWLHHLEQALGGTGAVVTAVRSPHFQEKVEEVLDAATGAGIYPVFADTADRPMPMAATRDIGAAAAHFLLEPPATSRTVALAAPSYTEREVAEALGAALGRDLQVQPVPQPAWAEVLTGAGLPPVLAAELAAMYAADQRGVLVPGTEHRFPARTPIQETLAQVLAAVRRS